jgi:serine protease inhibitor ecotin
MQNPENQKKALIERATQEGWGYDYFEENGKIQLIPVCRIVRIEKGGN